ncbi:hypothetical protein WG66_001051 [Moniliophthora roreri]|nr:hypothetical protein WG66_001051 [Moniliophthora roreri]
MLLSPGKPCLFCVIRLDGANDGVHFFCGITDRGSQMEKPLVSTLPSSVHFVIIALIEAGQLDAIAHHLALMQPMPNYMAPALRDSVELPLARRFWRVC